MQLKNQISFIRYAILTAIHIVASFYYFGKNNELVLSVVFGAFLVNQISLIYVVKGVVLDSAEERSNLRIFLLFALKFLTLAFGVLYGFENFAGNKLIIIGNYIFQLIILALSIKRYSKNIKEI
jgi:hypothetical protein